MPFRIARDLMVSIEEKRGHAFRDYLEVRAIMAWRWPNLIDLSDIGCFRAKHGNWIEHPIFQAGEIEDVACRLHVFFFEPTHFTQDFNDENPSVVGAPR